MNITVRGETYAVSDAVGRKFHQLMAEGVDEVEAAESAIADPAADSHATVNVNVAHPAPLVKVIIERDENGKAVAFHEVLA